MNEILEKTAEALRRRGFDVVCCATGAEARERVLKVAESAETIGCGGSMTLKEIGAMEALAQTGKAPQRRSDVDLFLLSANALTADGRI